jgi:peptidoglycan/LPS O-acetylase OafA/YrhL
MCVLPFLFGIGAAYFVRREDIRNYLSGKRGSIIALTILFAVVVIFHTTFHWFSIILLAIVFFIISCGNTLFGILSNNLSRILGEISYSMYLLHGITLFITFKFIIGFRRAATFSPFEHWLTILCCSAFLIPFCSLTFHFIEAPAMRAVPSVAKWARGLLTRQGSLEKPLLPANFDAVSQVPPGDL